MSEISRKQLRELSRTKTESGEKKKKGLKTIVFVAVIFLAVASMYLYLSSIAKKTSNEEKSLDIQSFANLGQDHIQPTDPLPNYNSNPPTSGPHLSPAAPWGAYDVELDDRQAIHNLEHGGVWITYNCKLIKKSAFGRFIDSAFAEVNSAIGLVGTTKSGIEMGSITADPNCQILKGQLEGFAKKVKNKKIVVNPRVANDHLIAVVAWGKLIYLDSYDEAKIQKFYDKFKNKGPEFIPD